MPTPTRTVEALAPIEWYDGIVTGFIRSESEIFMCVLLAFDASTSRRCYILVQLNCSELPRVALDGVGEFFRAAVQSARIDHLPLYTTIDEPLQGRRLRLMQAKSGDASRLLDLEFPRIDEATLARSFLQWYEGE